MTAPALTTVALWLGAWLRGSVGSDDVLDHVADSAPDTPLVIVEAAAARPWADLLSVLRRPSAPRAWLLLPRPGRTAGWPPEVSGAPEPAILVGGDGPVGGLIRLGPAGWRWEACGTSGAAGLESCMLTPREGARVLARITSDAAQRLEALGLQRPAQRPPAVTWGRVIDRVPPSVEPEVSSLLARLAVLLDALELAAVEDGAAVTAGEAGARSAQLRYLINAVEQLLVDVVNGLNAPRHGAVATARGLR